MKKLRWKRVLLVLLVLCALGLGALAAGNLWVVRSAAPWIRTPEDAAGLEADCVLVLGAGLWAPGQPSPMLADRIRRGLELWELGAGQTLLMSGDHGRADYNEVAVMRDRALKAGVPRERIFLDHAGFSTYESMVRAREIFGCRRVVIVTQQYHLYRAIYDARAMGMEAYGVAAEQIRYPNQLWRDTREVLARCKDVLYCLLRPAPTFLGEPIPISGDGTDSWDDAA